MWLFNSSVGRKFVMAFSGAFLLLFVTFHCVMNAVAIFWPSAYNVICAFLGANWYALIGTVVIAVFVLLHIILALVLTMQNRKARGDQRYSVSHRPAAVEWSSQNMLVLGIVILAFLVVHLIQFWAKMQLVEAFGCDSVIPPAAGTLFLQEAFSTPWTCIVYIIGFVALWFHLNHGFWSMFQSVGWDNKVWISRLKCIGCWWVSIVIALFLAEAVTFTVKSNKDFYKTDEALLEQYKMMAVEEAAPALVDVMGQNAAGFEVVAEAIPFAQIAQEIRQLNGQVAQQVEAMNRPENKMMVQNSPELAEQLRKTQKASEELNNVVKFFDYLEGDQNKPKTEIPAPSAQPYN